jgi:single-stranded DNA-binding protein
MFNKVILIGRLGKNAEVKTAQNKKDSQLGHVGFAFAHATVSGIQEIDTGKRPWQMQMDL